MLSPADYLLVLAYGLVKKSSTVDEHRFIFAALNDCFWPLAASGECLNMQAIVVIPASSSVLVSS